MMPRYEVTDTIGVIVTADSEQEAREKAGKIPTKDWYTKESTGLEVWELDPGGCDLCGGHGFYFDVDNGCGLDISAHLLKENVAWTVIERCDACGKYTSDKEAAEANYQVVELVSKGTSVDAVIAHTRKERA